jgi:hypothetical protein
MNHSQPRVIKPVKYARNRLGITPVIDDYSFPVLETLIDEAPETIGQEFIRLVVVGHNY